MLPDFLRSDYKTYKADTDAIATWLALTAKRCGYAPDLLESGGDNPTATSKRLKGKARKQTKEAKEAKQTKQAKLTGNFFPSNAAPTPDSSRACKTTDIYYQSQAFCSSC